MYLNFFGLTKESFNPTPDPAFLFPSPSHKEALGSIVYGVQMRKGFVLITGEVGTGKTTIIRTSLQGIDRDRIKVAYIFNPHITFRELLLDIFRELDLKSRSDGPHEMVRQLHQYLINEYKKLRNVVLIIDEAQNTPVETLESLRILSNLETTEDKLIQIILVGQPELNKKLNRSELRQLKQRVAIRTTMRHLTLEESRNYIRHRLSLAGSHTDSVFHPDAMELIVRQAQGIPRRLNIFCDLALIAAYGHQERPISPALAEKVIEDYEAGSFDIEIEANSDGKTAGGESPPGEGTSRESAEASDAKTASDFITPGATPSGSSASKKARKAVTTRIRDRRIRNRRRMMAYVHPDRRVRPEKRGRSDRRLAWRPPPPPPPPPPTGEKEK